MCTSIHCLAALVLCGATRAGMDREHEDWDRYQGTHDEPGPSQDPVLQLRIVTIAQIFSQLLLKGPVKMGSLRA